MLKLLYIILHTMNYDFFKSKFFVQVMHIMLIRKSKHIYVSYLNIDLYINIFIFFFNAHKYYET